MIMRDVVIVCTVGFVVGNYAFQALMGGDWSEAFKVSFHQISLAGFIYFSLWRHGCTQQHGAIR